MTRIGCQTSWNIKKTYDCCLSGGRQLLHQASPPPPTQASCLARVAQIEYQLLRAIYLALLASMRAYTTVAYKGRGLSKHLGRLGACETHRVRNTAIINGSLKLSGNPQQSSYVCICIRTQIHIPPKYHGYTIVVYISNETTI